MPSRRDRSNPPWSGRWCPKSVCPHCWVPSRWDSLAMPISSARWWCSWHDRRPTSPPARPWTSTAACSCAEATSMTNKIDNTRIDVTVTQQADQTEDIAGFQLASADVHPLPPFEAGAHIDVILGPELIRQYSLSNAPGSSNYRLGILNDPNSRGGSRQIHAELKAGAKVRISAPRNHFPLEMEDRKSVV